MNARSIVIVFVALSCLSAAAADAFAQPATLYTRALERERTLRDASSKPTLQQLRGAVAAYEAIVRRYPTSGYSDNALWQGGNLALLTHDRFGNAADLRRGLRLLAQLRSEYPSSSLVVRAAEVLKEREATASASAARAPASPPVAPPPPVASPPRAATPSPAPAQAATPVTIRTIRRTELPDGVRITIEMDSEVSVYSERIDNPSRVFFDLRGARPGPSLQDPTIRFDDEVVREVRLGRHPDATRVVMNMEGAESYSAFTLYDPFRVIVDFRRAGSPVNPQATPAPRSVAPPADTTIAAGPPAAVPTARPSPAVQADSPVPAEAGPPSAAPPSAPSANSDGKFSLSRQLGLGVSRVVIDAGHGGHDPGAIANGIKEAELTLDIAQRLQKLLQKQPGIDVVMTRTTDVFIPLEERTRIANRESADLFLSIHANASRNLQARGIETYFLNFALTRDAEAVAARENAGSNQSMHKLPEIVRAITLNNKINESRDFAEMVQRSMVRRLSAQNRDVRDIGVKQAPFVVLIGASMPSVLAEISFVTNRQDAALLKTNAYRQQIAEALLDAVLRYQQSLKRARTASTATTR